MINIKTLFLCYTCRHLTSSNKIITQKIKNTYYRKYLNIYILTYFIIMAVLLIILRSLATVNKVSFTVEPLKMAQKSRNMGDPINNCVIYNKLLYIGRPTFLVKGMYMR
jgi:hypothetical protein